MKQVSQIAIIATIVLLLALLSSYIGTTNGLSWLVILAAVIFIVVVFLKLFQANDTSNRIHISQLQKRQFNNEPTIIVAVDESPDISVLGDYTNTVLKIEKDEIPIRLHQLEPQRGKLIAILSKNNDDAEQAWSQLNQLGFPNLFIIDLDED